MKRTLIIGCGGVASVAIHKCCQNSEVFEEIISIQQTMNQKILPNLNIAGNGHIVKNLNKLD